MYASEVLVIVNELFGTNAIWIAKIYVILTWTRLPTASLPLG
jgi:hypothetical protein